MVVARTSKSVVGHSTDGIDSIDLAGTRFRSQPRLFFTQLPDDIRDRDHGVTDVWAVVPEDDLIDLVMMEPAKAVAHILNMPPIPQDQRASLLRRE